MGPKWQAVLDRKVKGKPGNFEAYFCVDHYILLLEHLSKHMRLITNGFKRFSWTNLPDPRQRFLLTHKSTVADLRQQINTFSVGRYYPHNECL